MHGGKSQERWPMRMEGHELDGQMLRILASGGKIVDAGPVQKGRVQAPVKTSLP